MKLASLDLHIKDLKATASLGTEREGAEQRSGSGLVFRRGSSPLRFLYLKIWEAAAPLSFHNSCSAQNPLSRTLLPPLATLLSIQTNCQLQTDVRLKAAGTKVLFSYFCFFHLSLHYP